MNNCDSKSFCNPGYGELGYAEHETCPLNVCCSKFGFCGLTKEFCGDEEDFSPHCEVESRSEYQRVVGYWEEWAGGRPCHAFTVEDFRSNIYTHINMAFATIHPVTFEVGPSGIDSASLYQKVTGLKSRDPNLRVYIALGGWTFNDPGRTRTTFSDIANSAPKQAIFI